MDVMWMASKGSTCVRSRNDGVILHDCKLRLQHEEAVVDLHVAFQKIGGLCYDERWELHKRLCASRR